MKPLPVVASGNALEDRFGRRIGYLRISLTDRCNLRCQYCMPAEGVPWEDPQSLLDFDEIERVVQVLAPAGLRKVRLTGGEPLVRKGVPDLVARLARIPGIDEITLTTNGILLSRDAQSLWESGIRRVNISLDSLRPERFAAIARRNDFARAWNGFETALAVGFSPVKLNCVVMRGHNDDEIPDFSELTFRHPIHVRFLEYMPIGLVSPTEWRVRTVSNTEVVDVLKSNFPGIEALDDKPESTSRNFRLPGALGTVGVINPISHRFCDGCNRLRLTADGKLVPCLSDNFEYDLRTPLRRGASDAEILDHVHQALTHKPEQSDFEGRLGRGGSLRTMSQIGG